MSAVQHCMMIYLAVLVEKWRTHGHRIWRMLRTRPERSCMLRTFTFPKNRQHLSMSRVQNKCGGKSTGNRLTPVQVRIQPLKCACLCIPVSLIYLWSVDSGSCLTTACLRFTSRVSCGAVNASTEVHYSNPYHHGTSVMTNTWHADQGWWR